MPGNTSNNYYTKRLSAQRLQHCYDIAPPRVRQYLAAELDFVLTKIHPGDVVLELGCGYGRVIAALAQRARWVIGVDLSVESLLYGQTYLAGIRNAALIAANAVQLSFPDGTFDAVICIQNGISAFHVEQELLFRESVRVTRKGGVVLYSTYAEKFWEDRLEWFRLQSEAGLLGAIDRGKSRDGVIVCKDGFTSSTVRRERFLGLVSGLDVSARIAEVDESSLFCELVVQEGADGGSGGNLLL